MSVDLATVKRVAHLARIAVPEADLPKLQGELNAMLGFVEQLNEVDVEGVEPMTSVIPVAMIGTNIAQPVGKRIPKIMRIGMVVGEPLDFSRYKGIENDRFILRSVTDEIMYAIMSLSSQEYVDVYAATQKARIAAGVSDAQPPADEPRTAAPGGRPVPDVQVPVPPQDDAEPSVG